MKSLKVLVVACYVSVWKQVNKVKYATEKQVANVYMWSTVVITLGVLGYFALTGSGIVNMIAAFWLGVSVRKMYYAYISLRDGDYSMVLKHMSGGMMTHDEYHRYVFVTQVCINLGLMAVMYSSYGVDHSKSDLWRLASMIVILLGYMMRCLALVGATIIRNSDGMQMRSE